MTAPLSIWKSIADSFYNNFLVEERYMHIVDGLETTLVITFFAIVLGTLLGGLVCWMRMNRRKWLQAFAKVYVDVMRGTPVLVMGVTPGMKVSVSYSEKTSQKEVAIYSPLTLGEEILHNEDYMVQTAILHGVCKTVKIQPQEAGTSLLMTLD